MPPQANSPPNAPPPYKGSAKIGQLERWAKSAQIIQLIGLDEAGRGPLAGPVVAGAVALPYPCPIRGLNDSKQLNEATRERLFDRIMERSLAFGIAECDHTEIDSLNILQASLTAMARAWQQVVDKIPGLAAAVVLVDGNMRAKLPPAVIQHPAIKGDGRSYNIAAASILAKVTRDRQMVAYHEQWPQYGFDRHKGYPTKAHRAAVAEHGPCPIHRRSFNMPAQMSLL